MFMDEYKFESMYQTIRNNEELTKQQKEYLVNVINQLQKITKEVKELENSNSDYIKESTELYNITNKLLLNLKSVNENFNNNVENLDNKIRESIRNVNINPLKITIEDTIFKIKNELQNISKKNKNDLEKLAITFKKNMEDIKNVGDDADKTIKQLDKTSKNISDKISNLNFKIAFFTGFICLIGGVFASQYAFFKYEKKFEEQAIFKKYKQYIVPKKYICNYKNKKTFCFNQKTQKFDLKKNGMVYVLLNNTK